MISRREFLKLAGFSTIAFAAGIKVGNLVKNSNPVDIYLTAFLPKNNYYLNLILQRFLDRVEIHEGINREIEYLRKISFSNNLKINNINLDLAKEISENNSTVYIFGNFIISVQPLDGKFNSDIFIKDDINSIYHPDKITDLFSIRDELRNQKAKVKLICEFRKENLLNKILTDKIKHAVVEVDNNIIEKIPLTKNYHNIPIGGINGKVHFSIEDGKVYVTKSTCRNKLCLHSGSIESFNQNIVCAPNKLLIKISNA